MASGYGEVVSGKVELHSTFLWASHLSDKLVKLIREIQILTIAVRKQNMGIVSFLKPRSPD